MGRGNVCRVPPPKQGYTTGEPGKLQSRYHVGIVEGSCGYRALGRARQTSESGPCGNCSRVSLVRARGVSIRVIIRFIEKRCVQGEGCRHVAKCSSDPRQAYPEDKLQGRDLVRDVGIVAPFAQMDASTQIKFVLSSPSGEMD